MLKPRTLLVVLLIVASQSLTLAQSEPNDPTGSLRSDGVDPTPGVSFQVASAGDSMDLEVSGLPLMPYILALGSYTANGTTFPLLGLQVLNLDLSAPTVIVGDGMGGTGILPAPFFFTDGTGQALFSLPTSAASSGLHFGFQAITTDPALPFGLNLTAAIDFEVTDIITTNVIPLMTATGPWAPGDDGIYVHDLAIGVFSFFGTVGTQITVSSNGWIRFDGTATDSDAFSDTTRFLDGTVGAGTQNAPCIAALWGDLDFTAAFTGLTTPGSITIEENLALQTCKVSFINGGYIFGGGFGDVVVDMNFSAAAPSIDLDYTNYANQFPQGFLFVGASDGDNTVGADVEADWVTAGVVNSHMAAAPFETYYQDFAGSSGAIPSENEDLAGLIIHMADLDPWGQGQWTIF